MIPWCPPEMIERYKVIILYKQFSGITKITDSFWGVVLSLNNKESSNRYLYANVLVFLIAALDNGDLFCTRYKCTSLKYRLFRYPAWISFTVTGKHVPFHILFCIIVNILSESVCLNKYLCITSLLSTYVCSLGDSCRYFFPGLSYTSWIIPSYLGQVWLHLMVHFQN